MRRKAQPEGGGGGRDGGDGESAVQNTEARHTSHTPPITRRKMQARGKNARDERERALRTHMLSGPYLRSRGVLPGSPRAEGVQSTLSASERSTALGFSAPPPRLSAQSPPRAAARPWRCRNRRPS